MYITNVNFGYMPKIGEWKIFLSSIGIVCVRAKKTNRGLCKLSETYCFSMVKAVTERDNYLFQHNMRATETTEKKNNS